MQWFRFYSEALDDPKVQRLPGDLFKAWVNLLCLANEQDERGTLPTLDDIAFRLRLDSQKAEDALLGLKRAGLLDVDEETDLYVIHAWLKRQPPSDLDSTATERKRRQRAKQDPQRGKPERVTRDVTRDNSVTSRTSHAPVTGDVTRLEKTREEKRREEESRPEGEGPPTRLPTPAPKRADAPPALPSTEQLVDDLRGWADAKGVRDILHDEVERFRDYCLSGKNGKPVTYADYPAACRKWITNPNYGHGPRPLPRASPNGYHKPSATEGFAAIAERFKREADDGPGHLSDAIDVPFAVREAHRRQPPRGA